MYFATPPDPASPPVPLHLASVHRRAFTANGEPGRQLERFTSDLAALYGVAPRSGVLARPHPSYASMSQAMLRDAVPDSSAGAAPELIVLAHAVPEVDPRRCVSTRLNQVSAGDPFGFGICDQGTAAPFTALALIGEQMRAGCRGALLIVLEQAELPYDTPPGTRLPERNTAVALLIETTGPARIAALQQHTAVAPEDLDSTLAGALAALAPGSPHPTILGPRWTASGMVCTAPWWTLADALDRHGPPHRTVVVDYEASLGYLCVLAVDTGSAQA